MSLTNIGIVSTGDVVEVFFHPRRANGRSIDGSNNWSIDDGYGGRRW
jgi:hypothetical protein